MVTPKPDPNPNWRWRVAHFRAILFFAVGVSDAPFRMVFF